MFPVEMRITPTTTITYSSGTGAGWSVGPKGMTQTTNHSVNTSVDRVDASAEL